MDTDEALFERLVAGDMRAFDTLYARFERPLFGFIRAQLGDANDAEDVFHEAFMAVLREREKRAEVRSFRAWIHRVAHHLCLNRVRSRRVAGRLIDDATRAAALGAPVPTADRALEGHELAKTLERAVAGLPQSLGEIYRLRASGLSYEEVAEVLAVPVGTVKSRMHEMVQRLRNEVEA